MKEDWVCKNCGDPYETGEHPYQSFGGVCLCNYCYEKLLEEKLPPKKVLQRLKNGKNK